MVTQDIIVPEKANPRCPRVTLNAFLELSPAASDPSAPHKNEWEGQLTLLEKVRSLVSE